MPDELPQPPQGPPGTPTPSGPLPIPSNPPPGTPS